MSEKIGFRVYEKDDIGFSDDIRRKNDEISKIMKENKKLLEQNRILKEEAESIHAKNRELRSKLNIA